jgi:hypothetical protein
MAWLLSLGLPLFLLVLGILLFFAGRGYAKTSHEKKRWPTVAGHTTGKTKMEPARSIGSPPLFHPLMEYTYRVEGTSFTSWQVYSHQTASDPRSCERLFKRLQGEVTVYYNPADPGQSFLVLCSMAWVWLFRGVGAALVLAGLLILLERVIVSSV